MIIILKTVKFNSISLYYQNIRGMRTKLQDIYTEVLSHNIDVLVITETWLHEGIFDAEIFDDRYHIFRRDRCSSNYYKSKKDGGGVLIAIKKKFNAQRVKALESDLEDLWIQFNYFQSNDMHTINICVTYFPPPVTSKDIEEFSLKHAHKFTELDKVIIIGDFNLNNITWSQNKSNHYLTPIFTNSMVNTMFLDFQSFCDLKQYNNVKNILGKILDLVFTNNEELDISVYKAPFSIAKIDVYHPPLLIDIKVKNCRPLNKKTFMHFNFNKADYEKINECLAKIDWSVLRKNNSCINTGVDVFYDILNSCIRQYVPKKSFHHEKYPKWFTKNIINMIKEKEKYRLRGKKFGNKLDEYEFKILSKRVKDAIKKRYTEYLSKIEDEIKNNPKRFWTYIKDKRNGVTVIPNNMKLGNECANNSQDIANLFLKHFSGVYNKPSNNSSQIQHNFSDNSFVNNLSKIYITHESITQKLKVLNIHKGAGTDGIPPLFFRKCADTLSMPLFILFNWSLESGIFPMRWKSAMIIPVPKSSNKNLIEHYRPISILPVPSKLFESLICPFITCHINQNVTLHQHGFFKKRSTLTNLTSFIDDVLKEISAGNEIDAIYSDFSKAFDKVDHLILLHKLQSQFGIYGSLYEWFKSYLIGRSQKVVLNGFSSIEIIPTSGVPQGSHLGPILFTIFINDLVACIHNSRFELYADDLKIFRTVTTGLDKVLLQEDLNRISYWCLVNNMQLNVGKCFHIKYSRKSKKFNTSYHINRSTLLQVNKVVDLGITIDSELKFIDHINGVIGKSLRMLNFINRNTREFKSEKTLKVLYYSLVRSNVDYCSIVYYPFFQNNIQRIERIQKKFVNRLAYIKGMKNANYKDKLKKFQMMSLSDRRQYLGQLFLYKILNNHSDCPYLLSKIEICVCRTATRAKNYRLFNISVMRNRYGHNAPLQSILNTYNNISNTSDLDVFFDSYNIFRNKLMLHFT